MATGKHRLRAIQLKARAPGYYPDGGGLYLKVALLPGGAIQRKWVVRFTSPASGKRREMGLGTLELIDIADARTAALEARRLAATGKDPIDERKKLKRAGVVGANTITFETAAARYIETHQAAWKNKAHRAQWPSSLKLYANPILGRIPVQDIGVDDVMAVLKPIWSDKTESATRLRGRIEAIIDWATASGFRTGENPARWRGHLQQLLPAPAKLKRVQHHPALHYNEIPALMAELHGLDSLSARALEIVILCGTRTTETTEATWDEFDLNAGIWSIPAARMKANRDHRIPLSGAAVARLAKIRKAMPETAHVLAKPGDDSGLSNMAMLMLLRDLRPGKTVHGFRSSLRDWAAEQTTADGASRYPREVAEAALAHANGDRTEAAYMRTDLFERRRRMMADWARHVTSAIAAEASGGDRLDSETCSDSARPHSDRPARKRHQA